jgi:hypothetical protein
MVPKLLTWSSSGSCGKAALVLGPAYDELFRVVVVEILFNEWRRVHRIEELVHVAQFQTYGVRMTLVRSGGVW